ncbi:hypothetical protein [Pengzhenrongella sicca]|uniref:Acetone carboxylase n=1 Tax=Pengzhenrongella sicca TaxID=2819238 RepID=A0A8A4ZJM8_9MICO|nr:hypothetical protein [Pengzhenrongella sicca]QTE30737.1 hypothetical protein J4E96_07255 [Pengzhenrongella sicca]
MTESTDTPPDLARSATPDATPDSVGELVCSARGCRAEATWGLLWNNPTLHTPSRRKVWLACDAHREHLEQYLGARSFLRGTVPVRELDVLTDEPPAGGTPAR